jgi:Spx/MgsR family transcriptional regulator
MADVEIYLYSNCSSCKNADALLKREGVEAKGRDLFKEKLSASEIKDLFSRIGLSPADVLSKRSRPYAELELAKRRLSGDEIVEPMAEYPALIRRPIVAKDGKAVIGFNKSAIEALVK